MIIWWIKRNLRINRMNRMTSSIRHKILQLYKSIMKKLIWLTKISRATRIHSIWIMKILIFMSHVNSWSEITNSNVVCFRELSMSSSIEWTMRLSVTLLLRLSAHTFKESRREKLLTWKIKNSFSASRLS